MDIKNLQDSNLDLILTKQKIIILEFYTSWCPTCKMVGMVLEEIEELHPEVFILQINADENKTLADLYKVRTAPTMLFIYNSKVYEVVNGFIEVEEIEEILKNIVVE